MPHVCGCVVDNAPGYDSYSRYCGTNCSVAHPCGAVPAPRRAVLVQTRTPPGMFPGGVLRVLHCWPGETPGTPQKRTNYLTVTEAPAPSRAAFAFSAASLLTFSRTVFGAPSTRSLASLSPRLVSVRTSLMTW